MISDALGQHFLADKRLALLARQLVAKARREQQRYLRHRLTTPGVPFEPEDQLFGDRRYLSEAAQVGRVLETLAPPEASRYASLGAIVALFRQRQSDRRLGASQINEVARAHRWLMEEVGADTAIDRVTLEQLREFRDNLQRIDVTCRGQDLPFKSRLTDVRDRQIRSETAGRYWASIQSLFAWAVSEGRAPTNPAALLLIDRRKGEERQSPEAYSAAELQDLFRTPLYAGYKSPSRLSVPGENQERGQHWWAGVLPLFSGIRAGELSQLLPSDFVFDAPVPHIKVREEDDKGTKTKSAKTAASIRDIPIAETLLILGLREFVERRAKIAPKDRVFGRFRLGGSGKLSEGMARFWGDYLRRFKLHKPGRGTHVMRHTVIARLRALDVAEEDIAATVGHERGTTTSRYGGAYPLERKAKTLAKLDYGFDTVELLGGPYVDKVHKA